MAINVQHAPISAALRLGQKAGEGDQFKYRHAAGQQLVGAAQQRREAGNAANAKNIQLAMAQQAQSFSQNQALRGEAIESARGKASADLAGKRQSLAEEKFQFEREKFGQQEPRREAESKARLAREERLSGAKASDPTKAPAFKAIEAILDPYQRQLDKIDKELQGQAEGRSFGDPKLLNAQRQQLLTTPIKLPDGTSVTPAELFDVRESYLAQALPMFEAAQAAEQAAQEKALTEAKVDETVDELAASLDAGTPTVQIAQQVIQRLGPASTPEEAMVIAEAVNEIEQKIRQDSGQLFPSNFGAPP